MPMPTPPNRTELLPGTLDLLVLKTLTQGTLHGYAIARHIQQRSQDALAVEEGTLYPALHRMHARGWIRAQWGAARAESGGLGRHAARPVGGRRWGMA